jgi:hypothetical protein
VSKSPENNQTTIAQAIPTDVLWLLFKCLSPMALLIPAGRLNLPTTHTSTASKDKRFALKTFIIKQRLSPLIFSLLRR